MMQGKMDTPHGIEYYVLCEAQEIPGLLVHSDSGGNNKWHGDTYEAFRAKAVRGDEGLVDESEKFLASIEDQIPVSRGWRNVEDVVGALPNVPAYLAGHPQCMRRRERVARDNAPIAIYMDLTSSAGIDARVVARRGVVLLALTRMLVEHRAVTLWVGVSQDVGSGAGTVAWRIDTMPLDLARAAYQIGGTAMSRRFGYGVNMGLNGAGGHWPFRDHELGARTGKERMQNILGCEVLYIPRIYLTDQMTTDPVAWLRRVMAEYVNV